MQKAMAALEGPGVDLDDTEVFSDTVLGISDTTVGLSFMDITFGLNVVILDILEEFVSTTPSSIILGIFNRRQKVLLKIGSQQWISLLLRL